MKDTPNDKLRAIAEDMVSTMWSEIGSEIYFPQSEHFDKCVLIILSKLIEKGVKF